MDSLDLLRPDDVPSADELRARAGWNQTLEDWADLLTFAPDGCFVARTDGRIVGSATVTPYAKGRAWIGMILVHPDHRRRGIATALLEKCLAWLRSRRTGVVALDASEAGESLYRKHGFRDAGIVRRWIREDGIPPTGCPHQTDSLETEDAPSLSEEDWRKIATLDADTFGADRLPVLRAFGQRARVACVRLKPDELEGCAFLRAGAFAEALAPVIAGSPAAARRLVDELLALTSGRPVVWDIPDDNLDAVAYARESGFTPRRRFTRMTLGGTLTGDWQRQWGILDPATG